MGTHERETASGTVMALGVGEPRLVSLGLYELSERLPEGVEPSDAHKRLAAKISACEKVLSMRASLRETQRQLLMDPQGQYIKVEAASVLRGELAYGNGRANAADGPVEVRFAPDELAVAVRALEAFLARENPATERDMRPGAQEKLIDPPEKVKPVLGRFVAALKVEAQRAELASAEASLLG